MQGFPFNKPPPKEYMSPGAKAAARLALFGMAVGIKGQFKRGKLSKRGAEKTDFRKSNLSFATKFPLEGRVLTNVGWGFEKDRGTCRTGVSQCFKDMMGCMSGFLHVKFIETSARLTVFKTFWHRGREERVYEVSYP